MLITLGCDQDIQHTPLLINSPPQVMDFPIEFDEDLIEVPLILQLRPTAPQLIGIGRPILEAPLTNRFVGHVYPTNAEEFFDITVAEGETEIQPDGVGNNLARIAIALVQSRSRVWVASDRSARDPGSEAPYERSGSGRCYDGRLRRDQRFLHGSKALAQ